ncbi:MAG: hypothetical protein JWM98_2542, partial [Thermoleophilia bacterium]|nr:hypothetical protein [Thermoleophilia bacterium]
MVGGCAGAAGGWAAGGCARAGGGIGAA